MSDESTWLNTSSNLANAASLLWWAYKSLPSPSSNVNWAGTIISSSLLLFVFNTSTNNPRLLRPWQNRALPTCPRSLPWQSSLPNNLIQTRRLRCRRIHRHHSTRRQRRRLPRPHRLWCRLAVGDRSTNSGEGECGGDHWCRLCGEEWIWWGWSWVLGAVGGAGGTELWLVMDYLSNILLGWRKRRPLSIE